MPKNQSSSVLTKNQAKRAVAAARQPADVSQVDVTARVRLAADAVVEASCLVALVSIPLFFQIVTPTGYEPDKAIFVRVFAAIAAGAWLVGFALEGSRALPRLRLANPILGLGALVFLSYVVATLLSIDPRLSLWGSQGRQAGLWSQVAYFILFVAAATRLRTMAQWSRVMTAFIFGSVPVVVYGFFQQFGFDPIPTGGDPTTLAWPVRSSLGQHVFLGAYLVMVIPFTAARALENWNWMAAPAQKGRGQEGLLVGGAASVAVVSYYLFMGAGYHRPAMFSALPALLAGYALLAVIIDGISNSAPARRVRRSGYAALLALQVLVLLFTGARGPWLGFFASVTVAGFLLARYLHRPQIARGILAVSLVVAGLVALLNIPGGPLQPLRTVHGISRLANITEGGASEGSAEGRLLIWSGVRNLLTQDPSVGGTWGGPARDLVGYGPETMHWAFEAVYPLKLRVVTSENWVWDRAHDIYLDRLVDAGLLGLLSFLALIALVYWRILALIRGASGMIGWLLIGAGAAIAGHLVEGIFGLETAATLLPLWIIIAFVAALPLRPSDEAAENAPGLNALPVTLWYGLGLVVVSALLAMISPSIENHPAILSAIWLLATVVGTGAVAGGLLSRVPAVAARSSDKPRKRPEPVAALPAPRLAVIGAIALAAAIALGAQMQVETAAIAEREGQTQMAELNPAGGLGFLQEATRADVYEPYYYTNLGAAYLQLGANRGDSSLPLFQPSLQAARTIDPAQAATLGKDQLFGLSEASLQEARRLAPLDPDMYNNLGNLYQQWNKPALALAVFQRAEQLSNDNPRYLDQQALTELQLKDTSKALSLALAAYKLDRTFWYTFYALASVYHQRGQHLYAKENAATAIAWSHNAIPPPQPSQTQDLQNLAKNG